MRCDAVRLRCYVCCTRLRTCNRLFCKKERKREREIVLARERVATNGSDGQRTKMYNPRSPIWIISLWLVFIRYYMRRINKHRRVSEILICPWMWRMNRFSRHLVFARALLWYHRCSFIETWIKKKKCVKTKLYRYIFFFICLELFSSHFLYDPTHSYTNVKLSGTKAQFPVNYWICLYPIVSHVTRLVPVPTKDRRSQSWLFTVKDQSWKGN